MRRVFKRALADFSVVFVRWEMFITDYTDACYISLRSDIT